MKCLLIDLPRFGQWVSPPLHISWWRKEIESQRKPHAPLQTAVFSLIRDQTCLWTSDNSNKILTQRSLDYLNKHRSPSRTCFRTTWSTKQNIKKRRGLPLLPHLEELFELRTISSIKKILLYHKFKKNWIYVHFLLNFLI